MDTTSNKLNINWTLLKQENLKRKTEFILTAAQNNVISTNFVRAKIDYMQQNSRCSLCDD